jgi:HAD superfamily, subfamily IIIB (Acid phosphatase)
VPAARPDDSMGGTMDNRTRLGRSRRLGFGALVVAISMIAGGVVVAAAGPAIQTFTPHRASQVTNIDVLRQQIRNYYGDPLGTGMFASGSFYAKETSSVASAGSRWLAARSAAQLHQHGMPAIVLDVDDTTLATWNYEVFSNWAYNPSTNATFVNDQLFPAVPGMVDMVKKAKQEGYAVIFITGRPATQEAATLGNLTTDGIGVDAGYPAPTTLNDGEDGLFTKPAAADYPDYLKTACADEIAAGKSCTTIHYKSATRAHIESLGYDIVANFGDQYSDLTGGYADRSFKLPNPNYYLP